MSSHLKNSTLKRYLTGSLIIFSILFSSLLSAKTIWLDPQQLDYEIYDLNLDDDFMFFESIDVYFFEAEVKANEHNRITLLPLTAIISALEINLSYDKATQTLQGQLNDNPIALNLNNPDAEISGDVFAFALANELYIDTTTLGYLIDSVLDVLHQDLSVRFTPNNDRLPLQKRIERSSQYVSAQQKFTREQYSFIIEDQYRIFTPPSGYITTRFDFNNQNNISQNNASININTYNDILYHSANFSLFKDSGSNSTRRLTLSRNKSTPAQNIFANIRRYSFGDVSLSNNKSAKSYAGVGVVFSSYENSYNNYFGKVTLDEHATANWQAELYLNGYLIERGVVASDGRIIFKDLDVHYGNNRFEIKTYGPYGEEETLERNVKVGNSHLKPNQLKYSVGLIDTNHSLLNDNNIFNSDIDFEPTALLQAEYGLNTKTSLGFSVLYQKQTENSTDNIAEAQLSISRLLTNALFESSISLDNNNNIYFNNKVLGSLGKRSNYNLGLTYSINRSLFGGIENKSTNLGVNARFNSQFKSLLYTFNGASQTKNSLVNNISRGQKIDSFGNSLAWRYKQFNFNNTIQYNNSTLLGSDQNSENITDSIAVSTALAKNLSFRLSGAFNLKSNQTQSSNTLTSAQASLDWVINQRISNHTSVNYNKTETRLTNNLNWRHDDYNFLFNSSYSDTQNWAIGLGISFGIDYDYHKNKINITNTYKPSTGTLDLFTFIDNNQNARFDEYDEPLSGVGFGSAVQWKNINTSEAGTAYLPGVSPNSPAKVAFNTANSRNTNLKAIHNNFRFYSHAGGILSLDIPFNYKAELEGNITFDPSVNAKVIPIQLLNKSGTIIQQVLADSDNYYLIEKVWPGTYQVQIDPDYLKIKSLKSIPNTVTAVLTGDSDYLTLPDLILMPDHQATSGSVEKNAQTDAVNATKKQPAPILAVTKPEILTPGKVNPMTQSNLKYYRIQLGAYGSDKACSDKISQLMTLNLENLYKRQVNKLCKIYTGEYPSKKLAQQAVIKLPESIKNQGAFIVYL